MGATFFIYKHLKNQYFPKVLVLLMFFAQTKISAQELNPSLRFEAAIDTEQIKIGEQFHLVLQAVTDSSAQSIEWPHVPDTFNHLQVVDRSAVDTIKNKSQFIYQQKYTLTGFDSGRWTIPSFQFYPVRVEDSAVLDNFKTDSLSILIHSVPVDTTKPFSPIKEIRQVPFNLLDYWSYIVGGLIVVLIILFFVFIYRRKKRPKKEKIVPQVPPYDQAIKNLNALEQKQLWQKGEVKEYYSELTGVLRLYIKRQYQINALEQTTDELLEAIKPVTRLNQQRDNLKYMLEMADLAKFAKLSPLPEEHEACMTKAKDFLEWTKPKPVQEEKDKKEGSNDE